MNGKLQNLMLTHLIDANGKRHYRVDSVLNSAAYYPQQVLEVDEVEKLCADERFQIQIMRTENESAAHSHEH